MRIRFALFIVLWFILLALVGCGRNSVKVLNPADEGTISTALSLDERIGYASWYGHPYHGRRTSNGETYDMYKMTAAHRTLPFDTVVRVSRIDNGKEVTVRINDRGPFVEDRIIDLSYAAAKQIEMLGPGTTKVALEVERVVANPFPLTIQVGAFRDETNARALGNSLEVKYKPVRIRAFDSAEGLFYRVLVGEFSDSQQAKLMLQSLKHEKRDAFLVRMDQPSSN